MKRYDIYAFIGYDYNGPYATWEHHLADEGSGQFVLHSEAQAEIERLRGLVEEAREFWMHTSACLDAMQYRHATKCTCGADDWQDRADALLAELAKGRP